MKKIMTLSAISLALLSAQAVAFDDRFYIEPSVNYTLYDDGLEDEIGYGVAMGKPITDAFDLMAEFVYNQPRESATARDTEYSSFAGGLRYYFDREMPIYLVGSVGYAQIENMGATGTIKADGFEVGAGAGVAYPLTDYGLAFVGEYRYLFRSLEAGRDIEANDHRITVGLRIPLGAPAAPAPEPAPLPLPPPPPPPAPAPVPPPPPPAPVQPEPIVLEGVNFEFDSSKMTKSSDALLDAAASALVTIPQTKVLLRGHTCNLGDEQYNQRLSERRAVTVKDYLNKQGVAAERIMTQGFGETMPVADNSTKAGREKNRRVDLQVLQDGACVTPAPGAAMDDKGCAKF